ncbi:MAG TPA: TPM domain-containing protein, partial [Gemmatimonadales bacterium]|nr:TPM domain-containing protein [Gemmatimonadales bacterium]
MIAFALLVQIAIPPPHGYVNDFAGVIDTESARHLDAVIRDVRAKTGGEIAVVTLADIDQRPASDIALRIGRQWGVGDSGAAGNPRKNLGVVLLLVPRKNHQPGTGDVFIATGRGAEGFLTDGRVGRIRDAMLPALAREDY